MTGFPIRQIAFFVADARAAAIRHSGVFGSGPFYLAEHIPLRTCEHRGLPARLDHTSAYGQWGDVMVEFVQQNNDGPSAFRDMFPDGQEGLHHVAIIVDDLAAIRVSMETKGYETAMYAEMNSGFPFVMMDAVRDTGHMIEIYQAAHALMTFYAMVKKASVNFNGEDLIRPLKLD